MRNARLGKEKRGHLLERTCTPPHAVHITVQIPCIYQPSHVSKGSVGPNHPAEHWLPRQVSDYGQGSDRIYHAATIKWITLALILFLLLHSD